MPTLLKYNTAEGGSNGVTVTTSNSGGTSGDAFNSITGTSFKFSTSNAFAGSLCYQFTSGVNSLNYTGLGNKSLWKVEVACYFTNISGTTTIVRVLDSGGTNYTKLEFSGSSQVFRVGNQTTNFGTSTTSIVASTKYFLTMEGTGTQVITKIYNSAMTLLETMTHSPANYYNMDQAQFGPSLAGPNGGYYDSLAAYDMAVTNHSFTTSGLTSTPAVGNPALSSSGSGNVSLAALGLVSTPADGHPALTQAQIVAANQMTAQAVVGVPALTYLGPLVTINSIKTGTAQYGQDYARVMQAPASQGALVTLWHKPDPINDVTYPRTCGNHEVLLLGGANWSVQNILDNMTVEATGFCSNYNQNTQFFAGAWGSETWVEDYTLYYNVAGTLTEAQVADWKFAAWQIVHDTAGQRFIFRQWIKFAGGSMMKTGASTEAYRNYDSIVTYADLRTKLVSRGWTQSAADAWTPSAMNFIGFGDNASGGANLPNITRTKAFDMTTEPTLAQLDAIAAKLVADPTAFGDWPFEYTTGPVLTDRSGNGRHLSTSGNLVQGYSFTFNEPLVTQLAASGLASSSTVGAPALGQNASLSAAGLVSQSATGSPSLGANSPLSANGLLSQPAVGAPAIAQGHGLTANGLASASSVGSPVITQAAVGNLVAVGINSASSVGSPNLSAVHSLSASGIYSQTSLEQPAATQSGLIGATSLTCAVTIGQPSLTGDWLTLPPVVYGGAWVTPLAAYVVVNGTWKQAAAVYAVKEGEWK